MSEAAIPSTQGYKELALAKQKGSILYKGDMFGENLELYIHLTNKKFACETQIEGKEVIMLGELFRLKDKKNCVLCAPKLGINPRYEDEGFQNTENQEKKIIDISEKQIEFEGCTLKLEGESPDLGLILLLEEKENDE